MMDRESDVLDPTAFKGMKVYSPLSNPEEEAAAKRGDFSMVGKNHAK
jgi:hypothetical protein